MKLVKTQKKLNVYQKFLDIVFIIIPFNKYLTHKILLWGMPLKLVTKFIYLCKFYMLLRNGMLYKSYWNIKLYNVNPTLERSCSYNCYNTFPTMMYTQKELHIVEGLRKKWHGEIFRFRWRIKKGFCSWNIVVPPLGLKRAWNICIVT